MKSYTKSAVMYKISVSIWPCQWGRQVRFDAGPLAHGPLAHGPLALGPMASRAVYVCRQGLQLGAGEPAVCLGIELSVASSGASI